MYKQHQRLLLFIISIAFLLLIPFIAMQFTDEVNWTFLDFVIAGTLMFISGILCELIIRNIKTVILRIIFCVFTIIIFFLIWAELAVGIFN